MDVVGDSVPETVADGTDNATRPLPSRNRILNDLVRLEARLRLTAAHNRGAARRQLAVAVAVALGALLLVVALRTVLGVSLPTPAFVVLWVVVALRVHAAASRSRLHAAHVTRANRALRQFGLAYVDRRPPPPTRWTTHSRAARAASSAASSAASTPTATPIIEQPASEIMLATPLDRARAVFAPATLARSLPQQQSTTTHSGSAVNDTQPRPPRGYLDVDLRQLHRVLQRLRQPATPV